MYFKNIKEILPKNVKKKILVKLSNVYIRYHLYLDYNFGLCDKMYVNYRKMHYIVYFYYQYTIQGHIICYS